MPLIFFLQLCLLVRPQPWHQPLLQLEDYTLFIFLSQAQPGCSIILN